MRTLPLSQGLVALIDDEDFSFLSKFKWSAYKGRTTYYAVRQDPDRRTSIPLHRQIMGNPVGKLVDHRNRNGLDNRKRNLRVCDKGQNLQNRGPQKNSKSGLKGVSWCARDKVWTVSICSEGRIVRLGYFDCPNEGVKAYNRAARRLHGKFAFLNPVT